MGCGTERKGEGKAERCGKPYLAKDHAALFVHLQLVIVVDPESAEHYLVLVRRKCALW